MIEVKAIADLHRTTVRRWHQQEIDNPYQGFLALVCEEHQRNFRLWHEEDLARSRTAGDAQIAQVKRNIDVLNQQRNDLIEKLDDHLVALARAEAAPARPDAPLNTETPGSVIDRLSILALRIYHLHEQTVRDDASEDHLENARRRLRICQEQYKDLTTSLTELLDDIFAGRKRLKVYRQLKMYNDPAYNPVLYSVARRNAA